MVVKSAAFVSVVTRSSAYDPHREPAPGTFVDLLDTDRKELSNDAEIINAFFQDPHSGFDASVPRSFWSSFTLGRREL